MIVDNFVRPFVELFSWLVGLFPEHDLGLPPLGTMVTFLAKIDSVIPIAPVLTLALAMLALGTVFVLVRLILLVRHIALP